MKRILYILIALSFAISASAQTRKLERRPYADQKRVHFGFSLGINMQNLRLVPNGEPDENGEIWLAEVPTFSPGFNVGLLCDLYLCPYLNLHFTPAFLFGNKTVTFKGEYSGDIKKTDVKSNYIQVPIELKYSSKRVNNYRPYIMAGIAPTFDVSKKRGDLLRLKTYDTYVEIGLGCDIYYQYFKFIPELKFSFGLHDILNRKRDDLLDPADFRYTASLDRVSSKMVILTFYFE